MKSSVDRKTVDLTTYPEMIVIYLGMRVRTLRGLWTLLKLGPQIDKAGCDRPAGLLHFENNVIYKLFPLNLGMRWYWRDFAAMEAWSRSETHRIWWQTFLKDSGGTGFWHETYFMSGGMEAIYDDMDLPPIGFQAFAPNVPASGPMFSARHRLGVKGDLPRQPAGVTEAEIS